MKGPVISWEGADL